MADDNTGCQCRYFEGGTINEGPGYLKRAGTLELQEIFNKYASVEIQGEKYMTPDDLIRKFLGLYQCSNYNPKTVKLLASVIDTNKDDLISFQEFQKFEEILCHPDALNHVLFQLFASSHNVCSVSFNEFRKIIEHTIPYQRIPFDLDNRFATLYFGKDKTRRVAYADFSQFVHDYNFPEEYAINAFRHFDPTNSGSISATDFYDFLIHSKHHELYEQAGKKLIKTSCVSFPYFMAFNSVLNKMEQIKAIYLIATEGSTSIELTKDEFLRSAEMISQVTPLEVDILFQICDVLNKKERIQYSDLESISPDNYENQTRSNKIVEKSQVAADKVIVIKRSTEVQENFFRFVLGAISGAFATMVVYPIDLIKTRIQNQRQGPLIKLGLASIKKVAKNEGFSGLYRGVLPQIIGTGAEKAIKLAVNDLVRDKFRNKLNTRSLPLWAEIVAGGCSGFSQVIITNPYEIVKVRLQVAALIPTEVPITVRSIIKELGFSGLFTGVRACLIRDIIFSAIYFPMYNNLKVAMQDEHCYNHPLTLLLSGSIASTPAAALLTPMDVIKTRLQLPHVPGLTKYDGVIDCAKKIYKEEGAGAFWKGTRARVARLSPQFGITLLTYELLQKYFDVDYSERCDGTRANKSSTLVEKPPTTNEQKEPNPDHIGGLTIAVPVFSGIESRFGLLFPKFK